jgi:DNA-binding GntR family transcriptional regulator
MEPSISLPRPRSGPSLTEQTYDILLEAILSLALRPGERLSVQRLSEQLGVSRTPVKEAFLRLEQDGLVSIVPKRGTFVSDITVEDVDEILEARILVESYAAGRAAVYLGQEGIAQAEAILQRMDQAYTSGRLLESEQIGDEFHRLLLSAMRNRHLAGFLEQLEIGYTRIRHYLSVPDSQHSRSIEEHYKILAAVKAGDAAQAAAEMNEHISLGRDRALSLLVTQAGDDGLISGVRKGVQT